MIAKIPILQMGSREQSIEEITVSANVEALFSANHAYYAYSGSLTTLPCAALLGTFVKSKHGLSNE